MLLFYLWANILIPEFGAPYKTTLGVFGKRGKYWRDFKAPRCELKVFIFLIIINYLII